LQKENSHRILQSEALDIVASVHGPSYDRAELLKIDPVLVAIADALYERLDLPSPNCRLMFRFVDGKLRNMIVSYRINASELRPSKSRKRKDEDRRRGR
jgi:hypothetical protein